MLIPSMYELWGMVGASLSRRVNANSQPVHGVSPLTVQAYQEG